MTSVLSLEWLSYINYSITAFKMRWQREEGVWKLRWAQSDSDNQAQHGLLKSRVSQRWHGLADLRLGTANGLLPVRVTPCSEWLEEEELEDLASLRGWDACSSVRFCLHQTTIWGDEVGTFLLRTRRNNRKEEFVTSLCNITLSTAAVTKTLH